MAKLAKVGAVQGAPIAPVAMVTIPVVPALPVDVFAEVMAELQTDISDVAYTIFNIEKSELNGGHHIGSVLHEVLTSQGVLTYGFFEAVRLSFGDAYLKLSPASADSSVRSAWSRSFGYVTEYFTMEVDGKRVPFTKPVSANPESIARAVAREKAQGELLVAYEGIPVETLREKAKALFNRAGDGDKKAKVEAEKILRVVDVRTKVEREQLDSEVKSLKKSIAESLKRVDDISVLSDILVMLEGAVMDAEAELDL